VKEELKRILPGWVKFVLYRYLWDPLRGMVWKQMNLDCKLPSGLTVQLRSSADWEIYNEILVNGEYDEAIELSLNQRSNRTRQVVDLGANVGYFVFRYADLFLQRFQQQEDFMITAIEGSPRVFAELTRRISSDALLKNRVRLINGLVGEQVGSAYISENSTHYGNSISKQRRLNTRQIEYVNLIELFKRCDEIDFLKCDIEGAEFTFLRNYRSLFKKVRLAVFEFHKYGEDINECRQLLNNYGLRKLSTLRETPVFAVELFGK
jgi:FkbM family methyltransferase